MADPQPARRAPVTSPLSASALRRLHGAMAELREALLDIEREQGRFRHYPQRGDAVEEWLKFRRDQYGADMDGVRGAWHVINDMLDQYREYADMGTALVGSAINIGED